MKFDTELNVFQIFNEYQLYCSAAATKGPPK